MYERYASFNRYRDISKFITDPDLLQVTWNKGIYWKDTNGCLSFYFFMDLC